MGTGLTVEDFDSKMRQHSAPVDPMIGQRFEYVCNCQQACILVNLIFLQAAWIAASVQAFMMLICTVGRKQGKAIFLPQQIESVFRLFL